MIENMKREKRTTVVDRATGGGRGKLEWNWSGEGGQKSGWKIEKVVKPGNGETSEGDGTGATCERLGVVERGSHSKQTW